MIEILAPKIKEAARKYGVPPIPIAGSIADEYNTRTGMKSAIDWFQDSILIGMMPNSFIATDVRVGFQSKFLNATKHDLGSGNIKLETAKKIYEQYKSTFSQQQMDWSDLVEYILTDKGTVHIAALVIKKAQTKLASYVKGLPDEVKEAIYVTYYKQGPSYVARYEATLAKNAGHQIKPGEGCRVLLQRDKFKSALCLV